MCTSLALMRQGCAVLAQNYDFYAGHGLVMVNPAGLRKLALADGDTTAARWHARFPSVTFNQFARELPICGINEAGLAVTSMWHDIPMPEPAAGEQVINELQWIQYQLDCHASVDELVAGLSTLTLSPQLYPMHYLVGDASGRCAVIEFVKDELQAYSPKVLCGASNGDYQASVAYARRYDSVEPQQVSTADPVLSRAAKAMLLAKRFNEADVPPDPVAYAFEALDEVRLRPGWSGVFRWVGQRLPPSRTMWQTVFDLRRPAVHFRTRGERGVSHLRLQDINLAKPAVLDLARRPAGSLVHAFRPYSRESNARLVQASFKPVADRFPPAVQEALIDYPETLESAAAGD